VKVKSFEDYVKHNKANIEADPKNKGNVYYYDLEHKKVVAEPSLVGITDVKELENIFMGLKIDKVTYSKHVKHLGKEDVFIYFDNKNVFFAKDKKELEEIAKTS
jgi:hypothetical protein